MKINLKSAFFVLLISVFSSAIFAQTREEKSEENIELPDVTTIISGDTFTAGNDSVPDYRAIMPESDSPKVSLPRLTEVEKSEAPAKNAVDQNPKEQLVFADGEIGGGYPLCFDADVSVYRTSGRFPFRLNFFHEGEEGFSGKKAEKGFFARETGVGASGNYYGDICEHSFSSSYVTDDDGLQSKSNSYTDVVKHDVSASYSAHWNLPKGFYIAYGSDGEWYRRYGQRFSGGLRYTDSEAAVSTVTADPFLSVGWGGAFGLDFSLTGKYGFQGSLETAKQLRKIDGSWHRHHSHRGQFTLAGSWHNSFLKVFADGSAIIGSATGKRDVIPAFTAGTEVRTSFFDFGDLKIIAKGGLDSYQEKISELERKYTFAYATCIPLETTDWFAQGRISIPVAPVLILSGGGEFRKTAFGNGVWDVDYDKKNRRASGQYAIGNYESDNLTSSRTDVSSEAEISAEFSIVKLNAGWKSHWKDVPVLEDRHCIYAQAAVYPESQKWSAGTSAKVAFGAGSDKCPDLGAWAEYEIIPAVSVALEVDDAIKLVRRTTRKYADSDYIEKAGCAKVLVKFQI